MRSRAQDGTGMVSWVRGRVALLQQQLLLQLLLPPTPVRCTRCAAGFVGYYSGGLCSACHDFASVLSVETGSCSSCTGSDVADCVEARCAAGFVGYYSGGLCSACHDFASVSSVETGSCSSCTGPQAADCVEARCAEGFVGYSGGGCWSVVVSTIIALVAAAVLQLVAIGCCLCHPQLCVRGSSKITQQHKQRNFADRPKFDRIALGALAAGESAPEPRSQRVTKVADDFSGRDNSRNEICCSDRDIEEAAELGISAQSNRHSNSVELSRHQMHKLDVRERTADAKVSHDALEEAFDAEMTGNLTASAVANNMLDNLLDEPIADADKTHVSAFERSPDTCGDVVECEFGPGLLGIVFNKADDVSMPLCIARLVDGSQAQHLGSLEIGAILHAVNGTLIRDKTNAEALAMISAAVRTAEATQPTGSAPLRLSFRKKVAQAVAEPPNTTFVKPPSPTKLQIKHHDIHSDLLQLKMPELRKRAADAGASFDAIEVARDAEQPKEAMISLIASATAGNLASTTVAAIDTMLTSADVQTESPPLKRSSMVGIDQQGQQFSTTLTSPASHNDIVAARSAAQTRALRLESA